jgi:hypothetical protein
MRPSSFRKIERSALIAHCGITRGAYFRSWAIHHWDAPEQQLTKIGLALDELNIEWIAARHKPKDALKAPFIRHRTDW